jgi:hypothetical protein
MLFRPEMILLSGFVLVQEKVYYPELLFFLWYLVPV